MIETCKALAIEAGTAILQVYNRDTIQVQHKKDASPITVADVRANQIICEGLLRNFPGIPIISEENPRKSFEVRKKYKRCWIVDPLDGTKEFVHRNGEFTVNIALVEDGKPVLGVVFCPVINKMAWGLKEKGAYLSTSDSETSTILKVRNFKMTEEKLKVLCSRSHLDPGTKMYLDQLCNPEIIPSGSSWKFIKIAMGQGDLYPRFAPTMEWDTCAAQIILEEAGGKVLNQENNLPLCYNKEKLVNPNFIAYGGNF